MSQQLNNKIANATKWSAVTEIMAKLVNPIVTIVLARLLTPDAFGVVATLTMIISFAEIFTDAGFQKYIIQHDFIDEVDKEISTNVAFWSNLFMSIIIWGIIALFSEELAAIVGNPGLGKVLTISCVSIPLLAFSSIHQALYKRDMNFKALFKVRMIGILVPVFVTVPLAFALRSFWALIIGTIAQNLVSAVVLTKFSSWRPHFNFSYVKLKEMLSFTIWSIFESISIWLTNYVDVFIVGTSLNQYYLGLYKTSSATVGQIMGLITGITTPILFSALSRLQSDEEGFHILFYKFQKYVSLLIMPIGIGIFCYRDLITRLLLGEQWLQTSEYIGLWGLTSAITIVLSHYSSEVYRSKGKPKLSVLAQILHLIVLWPAMAIAVNYGYKPLYITRSLVRLEAIIVNLILMERVVHISASKMLNNVFPSIISGLVMGVFGFIFVSISPNILWQFASIVVCVILYISAIRLFPSEKKIIDTEVFSPFISKIACIKKYRKS